MPYLSKSSSNSIISRLKGPGEWTREELSYYSEGCLMEILEKQNSKHTLHDTMSAVKANLENLGGDKE